MNPYPFQPYPNFLGQIVEELRRINEQLMNLENKINTLTMTKEKNYMEKDDNYYII